MYKNWLIRGDCHGAFHWINDVKHYKPDETAFIILGDFSVNYYLNNNDQRKKRMLESTGYTFYVVRGNHEARPQYLPGMRIMYDADVGGNVYVEGDEEEGFEEFPHIRYFMDYGIYTINGFSVAVIGGAYSVDKMNEIKDTFDWHVWVWGHFHADRLERPHCEMFYNNLDSLKDIYSRWSRYDQTGELDWWLAKGPMFYAK